MTDPREAGGGIAGPGGPLDRGQITFDMRNAVLAEQADVAIAHPADRSSPDRVAIVWNGRMNRPPSDEIAAASPAEPVSHLHLMDWSLAADVVANLHALAARDGFDFETLVKEHWARLEAAGMTRRVP